MIRHLVGVLQYNARIHQLPVIILGYEVGICSSFSSADVLNHLCVLKSWQNARRDGRKLRNHWNKLRQQVKCWSFINFKWLLKCLLHNEHIEYLSQICSIHLLVISPCYSSFPCGQSCTSTFVLQCHSFLMALLELTGFGNLFRQSVSQSYLLDREGRA